MILDTSFKRNVIIGMIFGGIFSYFAFKNTDIQTLKSSIQNAKYVYVVPVFLFSVLILFLRSYRWGIILEPLERIDQRILFPITSFGLMATMAIPARLGELVRPYLISRHARIKMSSALATILVERIFDVLTLMGMLLIAASFATLPLWALRTSFCVLIGFVIILGLSILLTIRRDLTLEKIQIVLGIFPSKLAKKISSVLTSFAEGLKILPNVKSIIFLAILSIAVWVCSGLSIYILFFSFGLKLPLVAAYAVLTIVALGLMVPTAPGFVGNFHLFCVIALAIFDIPKTEALPFAILLHFIQVGLVGLMGLAFIPLIKIRPFELFVIEKQGRE